jgi:anti-anti-sigma factor
MVHQDEQGIFHLHGELSIHHLESLHQSLTDLLYSKDELVLSFAEVTFIDTAALQLLLAFRNSLPPNRIWLVVAISERMERILFLSGLKNALVGYEE